MNNDLLQQSLEALEDLLLEFRGHDLPCGSNAYSKGIDVSHKIKAALASPPQHHPLGGIGKAAIGEKYFGNPIPEAWYLAAKELEAKHCIGE
jgi:hypothetical protein